MTIPDWIVPMAATLTQDRFTGPDWLFERKLDGIRLLAFKNGNDVRLFSRNRLPQHVPAVAAAIDDLPAESLILDGEITWDRATAYHVFDIMWLDGQDLTGLPLHERQALLASLPIRAPLHRVPAVGGAEPWVRACGEGWEGVIAKRRDSPYEQKRSKHWLKMKCELSRPFVVGGFTDPQGGRIGLGALLVGYYHDSDFVFAGKVGTGFDTSLLISLRSRLDSLAIDKAPFTRAKGLPRIRAHWVRPELVVEVAFIEWTVHEKLRHSRLRGVRTDLQPVDVKRDVATVAKPPSVVITHPDKVMFPDDGITKGELAEYYEMIAPIMVPHLSRRPVTMERFHRGIGETGFFQKNVSRGFPAWLERVAVPKKDGVVNYPLITDARGLAWLANQNCITPHVWTSRAPDLHHPDLCVFDLDPLEDEPIVLRDATLMLRDTLGELGCTSWVKTSGSKGYHVVVPMDGTATVGDVARFAHGLGRLLVSRDPRHLTQEFYKADRGGRILIDTGRNEFTATFAAAYAVRARPGAPISAPCTWDEVERLEVLPQTLTLRSMQARVDAVGDVWADLHARPCALPRSTPAN